MSQDISRRLWFLDVLLQEFLSSQWQMISTCFAYGLFCSSHLLGFSVLLISNRTHLERMYPIKTETSLLSNHMYKV